MNLREQIGQQIIEAVEHNVDVITDSEWFIEIIQKSVFDSEWFRQTLLDAVAIELKKLELEKK
jgi:hypothetical protein